MTGAVSDDRGMRAKIYEAFRLLLGEGVAGDAVTLWQEQFAGSENGATPLRFMRVAQQRFDLSHDVKKELIHYIADAPPQVDAPPTAGSAPAAPSTPSAPAASSGTVTRSGAEARAARTAPRDSEFRTVLRFVVHRMQTQLGWGRTDVLATVPPARRGAVEALLAHGEAGPEREQHALAGLLMDALYTSLCDVFGPVASDEKVAQIVRQAEMLPEAEAFSPRRLL